MCLTGPPLIFVRVLPEQAYKYRATYHLSKLVVLNWRKFCPQGILRNEWRLFWLSQLGSVLLVSSGGRPGMLCPPTPQKE